MVRFARIDAQILANRLIPVNRFRIPELNPFFANRASGGLKIANRRFEAIRANRSHVMRTGFFFFSRAAKRGGFKRGGFPIWTCPSFLVLFLSFWDFPDFSGIFPTCSGMVRGFSRFVLFLFLGLLRAPTRNSPERVRDTIWTFPEKSGGNPRVWKPPGLASHNQRGNR